MKNVTLTKELKRQIQLTESQLAIRNGQEIFLIASIKEGRNRVYLEMKNHNRTTCKNLRTVIKQGLEFITFRGEVFTPKSWDEGMFILNDGRRIITGYTSIINKDLNGSYA